MNKLLTVSDVSKILRVSRNKVYMLIHNNELHAYDINGYKTTEEDLADYISSRILKPETEKGANGRE